MEIKMNKKQLTDLIKKYQKEEMDFDGDVELVAKEYHDMRDDDYTVVKAVTTGKLQLVGENYDLIQELNQTEIEKIIKFYMEKAGHQTGCMRFTSKKAYDKQYEQYDDYHGYAVFDNVEIEIKGKTKKIGSV